MIDNLIGRVVLSGENEITDDKGEKLYSLLDCDGSVLDVGRYPVLWNLLAEEQDIISWAASKGLYEFNHKVLACVWGNPISSGYNVPNFYRFDDNSVNNWSTRFGDTYPLNPTHFLSSTISASVHLNDLYLGDMLDKWMCFESYATTSGNINCWCTLNFYKNNSFIFSLRFRGWSMDAAPYVYITFNEDLSDYILITKGVNWNRPYYMNVLFKINTNTNTLNLICSTKNTLNVVEYHLGIDTGGVYCFCDISTSDRNVGNPIATAITEVIETPLVSANLPNIPDPTNGGITGKYKIIADK